MVSGAQRDTEALRQACGGLAFDVSAAPKDAEAFARALYCSNLLSEVSGDGVAEILGIGSGSDGRFTVVGKLVASSATIALANTGTKFNLDAASAREGSTIAHAWAALRVAQLTPRADENADELLALGRRFGVVSPATSLLVLESLDQWLRYDIEPPTTWESMHREWEIRREGRMQISSEEEMEQTHLINLIRAWIDLRSWWMQDHTAKHVAITPDGLHLCPRCGRAVAADARFCPYCGTPVGEVHDEYEANFGGPTIPDSALLEEPIGDAATVSYERLALSSAPRMMAQQEPVFASAASGAAIGTADFATDHVCGLADDFASEGEETTSDRPSSSASVQVKAWMPDAAYLKALTGAQEGGISATHDAYFQQRAEYSASPAFFIDCACWFLAHDDKRFGLRVLSNLAELRIEDAALLRVMAWRLREAGELHQALVVLRRVLKLRPEDSQNHRDCALVLDELARATYRDGDEAAAKELIEEAGAFYRTIALTPWQRRAVAISLFAVEEYNVMCAWASEQTWEQKPQLELIDEDLDGVLDCDLRITLAWDADETDVDLHVTEPSGEEAYFGNRRTHSGGRVSEDITDGYGPEQYEIRHAQDGVYNIRAHYYASHQQTIFGPASCTLTVYTDWGRPTQKQQITSTRLEAQKEMVTVGSAIYGTTAQ